MLEMKESAYSSVSFSIFSLQPQNSENVNLVADLYAEIVGVLSQSRYAVNFLHSHALIPLIVCIWSLTRLSDIYHCSFSVIAPPPTVAGNKGSLFSMNNEFTVVVFWSDRPCSLVVTIAVALESNEKTTVPRRHGYRTSTIRTWESSVQSFRHACALDWLLLILGSYWNH